MNFVYAQQEQMSLTFFFFLSCLDVCLQIQTKHIVFEAYFLCLFHMRLAIYTPLSFLIHSVALAPELMCL